MFKIHIKRNIGFTVAINDQVKYGLAMSIVLKLHNRPVIAVNSEKLCEGKPATIMLMNNSTNNDTSELKR